MQVTKMESSFISKKSIFGKFNHFSNAPMVANVRSNCKREHGLLTTSLIFCISVVISDTYMESSAGQTACERAEIALLTAVSASATRERRACCVHLISSSVRRRPFAYLLSGGDRTPATSISANAVIHIRPYTCCSRRSPWALNLIMFAVRRESYCTWAGAQILCKEIPRQIRLSNSWDALAAEMCTYARARFAQGLRRHSFSCCVLRPDEIWN